MAESLPGHDPERRALARLCLVAIKLDLIACHGRMPGATGVVGLRPPVCLWRFHSGWWKRYCVETIHPWFRSSEVRIVVLEVTDRVSPTPRVGGRADG